ncbi:MAG: hypothetical protein ROO76_03695 [Terriglobia bacterium]|jgi:hypothetical protein|nr:hypothetical protein [Terriglobia bacterium]
MRHKDFGIAGCALLLLFVCWACQSKPSVGKSRVVGAYSGQHDNGDERLALRSDGTYVQRYQKAGVAPQEVSDRWDFKTENSSRRPVVVLHNFTPHFPRHDGPKKDWELAVEEDAGMIRLYVDSTVPRDIYLGAPDANDGK